MFLSVDRLDVIETETFFNYFIKVIKAHTLADNLLSGEILADWLVLIFFILLNGEILADWLVLIFFILLNGEILAGLDLLYSFKWCIILY